MKLTVPTSIILAAVILVIGFFSFDYYKTYQVRKSCEKAWEGFKSSSPRVYQTKVELCVLENS